MITMQNFVSNVNTRADARAQMMKALGADFPKVKQTIMLCEILDDMLIQKIQSDIALEGILKDIQGNTASMADMDRKLKEAIESSQN